MADYPNELGKPEDILKRAKQSFARDDQWRDLLQDAYDYFLPQRELLTFRNPGQKKMDQIFDSTAMLAVKDFANKMQANITPIWQEWATFDLPPEVQAQVEIDPRIDGQEIKRQLQQIASITFSYINNSNFATQINEAYLDLAIGTAAITVQESDNPAQLIEFATLPQINIGFEVGSENVIENVYRKVKKEGRNVERFWPGIEISGSLKEKIDREPNAEISFTEAVIYEPESNEYWGVVIPDEKPEVIWSENYGEFGPWVVGRWAVIAGEIRGRGPALDALPDTRSLNKIKEFSLRKAAIDLSGIWTAVDDGVTNPYNIRIQPGIVIPVGTNDRTSPSLQRLDTTNDLRLTQFEVNDLRTAIKTALFNDLRDPTGPVRSATEIAIDARELAQRIGSSFGRLQTEILIPLLNRVMQILKRNGKIPDIRIDGRQVSVKFTSPLARAQDGEELIAAQQAVQFTAETAGPESIPLLFKVDQFGEFAAKKTGMDATLVLSETERREAQQAVIDQSQAETMIENQQVVNE